MIVRGPRVADNFTVIHNDVLRDTRLSYRARGILCYLLSMPAGWAIRSEQLAREGREGRDAVRHALTELEIYGYLVRTRRRGPHGRWSTESTIYEQPVENPEPAVKKPVENPVDNCVTEDGLSGVGKPVPIRRTIKEELMSRGNAQLWREQ